MLTNKIKSIISSSVYLGHMTDKPLKNGRKCVNSFPHFSLTNLSIFISIFYILFYFSIFATGFALDFGAFLFEARARLAFAGDRLAYGGSGNSAVGPFSPG